MERGKKIEESFFSKGLKGLLTDFRVGERSFEASPFLSRQHHIEVLAQGELVTKEIAGRLALLHKWGSNADQVAHWHPVVLLNITNQLIAYVINERLTEMVEHTGILTQAQGGFRRNKSTDINACKLYGLTKAAQRLKKRFLRVDIDFKSAFNSR